MQFLITYLLFQESIIDVFGIIQKANVKSPKITQQDAEIRIRKMYVVSKAAPRLPLQIDDASRPDTEESELAVVKLDTRLDFRLLFYIFDKIKY